MPFGLYQEIVHSNGVEFAVALHLTADQPGTSNSAFETLGHLVVGRTNVLKVFEIRRHLSNLSNPPENGSSTRLHLLREHRLHGSLTGLDKARILSDGNSASDCLVVSFKDAKLALMEWSPVAYDLVTISIHTFERVIQLSTTEASHYKSVLRVDPASRCCAISLPNNCIAILPFVENNVELDNVEQAESFLRDVPYSPSFTLDIVKDIDPRATNVTDLVFLPGFNYATIAILYQTEQTWAGLLEEFKDTSAVAIVTLDYGRRQYPSIARIESLPYDSSALYACPSSFGGVLVVSSNAIFHADQSTRVSALPVTPWAGRISSLPTLKSVPDAGCISNGDLDGAKCCFVDDGHVLMILATGDAYVVKIELEGRVVTRLSLQGGPSPMARTVPPSIVLKPSDGLAFVGSCCGSSLLLQTRWESVVTETTAPDQAMTNGIEDDDIDMDLYGDSSAQAEKSITNGLNGHPAHHKNDLRLAVLHTLYAWGNILDMTMAARQESGTITAADLIASTGAPGASCLTRFQSRLPTSTSRSEKRMGGNRGVWSFTLHSALTNGDSHGSSHESTRFLVTSQSHPTPGSSRIFRARTPSKFEHVATVSQIFLAVGPLLSGVGFVAVSKDFVMIFNTQGGKVVETKVSNVSHAVVSAPYVILQLEDGVCEVFDVSARELTWPTAPVMTVNDASLCSLFRDSAEIFVPVPQGKEAGFALCTYNKHDEFEIRSLATFDVIFSSSLLPALPEFLSSSKSSQEAKNSGSLTRESSSSNVTHFLLSAIGESAEQVYLTVITKENVLVLYQAIRTDSHTNEPSDSTMRFVKILSKALNAQAASASLITRALSPFQFTHSGTSLFGVFGSGISPFWLVAKEDSTVKMYQSMHSVVFAFAQEDQPKSSAHLVHDGEILQFETWNPDVFVGEDVPVVSVETDTLHSHVEYHSDSQHLIVASLEEREFGLFDDEALPVWTPDAPAIQPPKTWTSSLELVNDQWEVEDGFDFPQFEKVSCLKCIPMETASTVSGMKLFVVAGVVVDRGEELVARGAVYVFDVVEVVSEKPGVRRHRLKFLCRDDCKAPVTALCGINGYLASSVGQKIFVRAFEMDERLVGVAFLDVGIYVTTLSNMKNLLLIGDVQLGVQFVAFQEEPFKLQVIARRHQSSSISTADFFFGFDSQLSFLVASDEGVIRILDWSSLQSNAQRLMCRTEFDTSTEHHCSILLTRKKGTDATGVDLTGTVESVILYATLDGGLATVSPVSDTAFKRLSLLQGLLVRNVQHFAGLNPRSFRTVRNESLARPLAKGMLDKELLTSFLALNTAQQLEITKRIGTSRALVLHDLAAASEAW